MKHLTTFLLLFSVFLQANVGPFPGGASSSSSSGGVSAAVTSINADTTAAQTLSTGTSGTDFAIADGGSGAHTFNLPAASATASGKVTTGAQSFAGTKTLLAAPVLDSLTAQAMPYLNASKVLANGVWTQADTTGKTVFTSAGTLTGDAITFDFSSTTSLSGDGLQLSGGGKPGEQVFDVVNSYSNAASAKMTSFLATGTSTSGYNFGIFSEDAVACTGDVLGWQAGSPAFCSAATFVADSGAGSAGTQVGVYGSASNGKHSIGGAFQGVAAKNVANNKAVGVHATASGENSAQTIGIFTKTLAANSSANLENFFPSVSGALMADNGDMAIRIFSAFDNGTEAVTIADGGSLNLLTNASLATGADVVRLGGYDIAAGQRTLALATEEAVAIDAGVASTHSLTIRINGVNYKVLLATP